MDLKVGKTFERLGQRYRPGDAAPPDLDKPTVQHYLRHGMLVEVAAAPAARRARAAAPRQCFRASRVMANCALKMALRCFFQSPPG